MKRIFICSPYSGDTPEQISKNVSVAKHACLFAIRKGHAPFAPHLIYPLILDDDVAQEREAGIDAGLEFLSVCDEVWVIGPRISRGMEKEIEYAKYIGIRRDYKSLKEIE